MNPSCPPRRSCVRRQRRPPAAVDNSAPMSEPQGSTYRSQFGVQTTGATSVSRHSRDRRCSPSRGAMGPLVRFSSARAQFRGGTPGKPGFPDPRQPLLIARIYFRWHPIRSCQSQTTGKDRDYIPKIIRPWRPLDSCMQVGYCMICTPPRGARRASRENTWTRQVRELPAVR